MESRWGHASTYIPSPPALLIQGGKTDPSGAYTYTSALNTGDTLLLPLSSPFNTSSPPWKTTATPNAPDVAWHTLSTLSSGTSYPNLFIFGGDGGPTEATQTQADSTWLGTIETTANTEDYARQATAWGSQPIRRLYHSAAGPGKDGKVYITGGVKDDGSGVTFSEVYAFDPKLSVFTSLTPLPQGIYHHTSALLPNGTLVLVGGVASSVETGNADVLPLTGIYVMDTTADSTSWIEKSIGGDGPSGRRGASLTLIGDGSRAFLFGGADSELTETYGDGWELDLIGCLWKNVTDESQGPGMRFDHSAVAVGGDQVILFGGYQASSPADSKLYIWNTGINSWSSSFSPGSGASTNPSASGVSQSMVGSATQTVSQTGGVSDGSPGASNTISNGGLGGPSTGASASPSSKPENGSFFTTPVTIGFVFGMLAVAGVLAGGLVYLCRRRQRRQALLLGAAWRGSDARNGDRRAYGPREKAGTGLMDESNVEKGERIPAVRRGGGDGGGDGRSPMIGLGMGRIGASLARIASRLTSGRTPSDTYAVLHNEGQDNGGPMRRPTRNEGNGIRLVGPPGQPSTKQYAPIYMGNHNSRPSLEAHRHSRIDMLGDEDSRRFAAIPEEDWVITEEDDAGRWKSARSLLQRDGDGDDSDPFEDGEVELGPPPIRGGPVPTPRDSRCELNPFDDERAIEGQRVSQYLSPFDESDITSLRPPKPVRYSDHSIPQSARSGRTDSSLFEEGKIEHATIASHQAASVVSPVESSYEPIRRSESFFWRMTQGGISLLSRQGSTSNRTPPTLDIRDPTPAPALWPIESRDRDLHHPSTSFSPNDLVRPSLEHIKGPSLSSLQSARSMRDMVIVQRDQTTSPTDEEEAMVESNMSTPDVRDELGHHRHGLAAVTESPTSALYAVDNEDMEEDDLGRLRQSDGGGRGVGRPDETPGSIIFYGGEFATSPIHMGINLTTASTLTLSDAPATIASDRSSNPQSIKLVWSQSRDETPTTPEPTPSTLTQSMTQQPSGSPVPSPLINHRRPVRDVVNSINKRSTGVPPAFTSSPGSAYTSAPVSPSTPRSTLARKESVASAMSAVSRVSRASGSTAGGSARRERPMTMYEAVKRERLLVANPDGIKRQNSG